MWCYHCQQGHEPIDGKCPRCGHDLPGKKPKETPQREYRTVGGYTDDKSYETRTEVVYDKPKKDLYKKQTTRTRKRKYRKRKEKVSE